MDRKSTQTPAQPPAGTGQRSIRSFFQPRLPTYVSPPVASTAHPPPGRVSPPAPAAGAPPDLKTASPTLPAQARIARIEPAHLPQLRRINSLLLPINYPDSFYNGIVDPRLTPNLSRVVVWQDRGESKVVGSIVCRVDEDETGAHAIYILSLGILSPYRSLGLASALLETVVANVVRAPTLTHPRLSLYAHVWTENADALQWYLGRGFRQEEPVVHGYYRRLKPDSAWIVSRDITPSDYLRHASALGASMPPPAAVTATSPPPPPPPGMSLKPPVDGPDARTSTSGTEEPQSTRDTLPPPPTQRSTSYQTARPANEWNDLPEDMMKTAARSGTASPAVGVVQSLSPAAADGPPSSGSSRSSSRTPGGAAARKKRAYPAAAFGAAGAGA